MRKERHHRKRDWPNLRNRIARTIAAKEIRPEHFSALSIHENWQQIDADIYHTFCFLSHPVYKPERLWNYFKRDTYAAARRDRPEQYLDQLIDPAETVWCILNETVRENNKRWHYEGKIQTIREILEETVFSTVCIVSKKYEWMLCINHYDNLIATGNRMPDKLRQLFPENLKHIEHS